MAEAEDDSDLVVEDEKGAEQRRLRPVKKGVKDITRVVIGQIDVVEMYDNPTP
jgi:hypothetical protein